MERTGGERIWSASPGLPQGYTVRTESVLEEETGQAREVLLLMRADGGVVWVFSPSESYPAAEAVSARAWDDYRTTGGPPR